MMKNDVKHQPCNLMVARKERKKIFKSSPSSCFSSPFLVHNHQGCLLSYDSRFDYLSFFSVNNNEREKNIIKGSLFAFGYLSSVDTAWLG